MPGLAKRGASLGLSPRNGFVLPPNGEPPLWDSTPRNNINDIRILGLPLVDGWLGSTPCVGRTSVVLHIRLILP